jgi:hypothetical protein
MGTLEAPVVAAVIEPPDSTFAPGKSFRVRA